MRLNEEINKISRLLNNSVVFPKKKENIQETPGPANPVLRYVFDLPLFLEKLGIRMIPKENKIANQIIDMLDNPTIRGVEFDAGTGVVRKVFFRNMSDQQLVEFFRVPEVREALEDMAKNYRPRPDGPIVPFNLNNTAFPATFPNTEFGRIVKAYQQATSKIANLTKIEKNVKIPLNQWIKKYWTGGKIVEFFTDKIKYNHFLREIRDSITETKYLKFYESLYSRAEKVGFNYQKALETPGVSNFSTYEKELIQILKEFEIMTNNVKQQVFKKIYSTLPTEVTSRLDQTVINNPKTDELTELWGELSKFNTDAKVVQEKYTYWFGGIMNIFRDMKRGGGGDALKRTINFLLTYDARLNREVKENIKAEGRFGYFWREAFLRAGIIALWTGFIDYWLAKEKNDRGEAWKDPVLNTTFEPTKEWGQPEKFVDNKTQGAWYFLKHMGMAGFTYLYEHPIKGTQVGPVPRYVMAYFDDPERQKKKKFIETKIYQEELNRMLKDLEKDPKYMALSAVDKKGARDSSIQAFEESYGLLEQLMKENQNLK
jgi:hypothetical protein